MDNLGSSVPAEAAGRAVRTWAAHRQIGGVVTVDLLRQWAPLGVVAKFGNSATTVPLPWVLSVRGRKGFGWERGGGGEKSVHGDGGDRVTELTTFFLCVMFDALILPENVWGGGGTMLFFY